jgi:hypothetical protein
MRGYRLILVIALVVAGVALGRAQWQMQTSNTTADLRGIDNVGNGVAWASGTNGTVLRTEDGGYVWQTCAVPPGAEKLDFRGVQAFDANTAIVMSSGKGDLSRLYKTTDGCHTWKLVFTNPDADGFWDAIRFADNKVGVLAGDAVNGKLYARVTNDGGSTWKQFDEDDALRVGRSNGGMFAASNSTLLVLRKGRFIDAAENVANAPLLYHADLGDTCNETVATAPKSCHDGYAWSAPEDLPLASRSESSGVFAIADREEPNGKISTEVAVGGDYTKPDSVESTAAYSKVSQHWTRAQTPPHGYRSSVAYDEKTKTWITVGPNGTDISTDDGKNWRAIHPDASLHEAADADRNWNALSLPYVVGPTGRIGKLEPAALKK